MTQDQIREQINDIYKADIEAIKNLSNYATYLMNGNTAGTNGVTVPANLTASSSLNTVNLNLTGKIKIGNTELDETKLINLLNGNFSNTDVNVKSLNVVDARRGIILANFRIQEFAFPNGSHGIRFLHSSKDINNSSSDDNPYIMNVLSGIGQVTILGCNNNERRWVLWDDYENKVSG